MFQLKPLSKDAIPAALVEGRALSAAERAGRGREHLPRRPADRSRQPGGARHADPRADRSVPAGAALVAQRPGARDRPGGAAVRPVRPAATTPASSASGAPRRCCSATGTPRAATAAEWLREAMALLRARRSDPPGAQRRRGAALECVRAPAAAPAEAQPDTRKNRFSWSRAADCAESADQSRVP